MEKGDVEEEKGGVEEGKGSVEEGKGGVEEGKEVWKIAEGGQGHHLSLRTRPPSSVPLEPVSRVWRDESAFSELLLLSGCAWTAKPLQLLL